MYSFRCLGIFGSDNQALNPADQAAYKAANDAFLMSQGNVQTDDMPF